MANIKQLDQHVANLIAAGEVIERAASVVKELVENSIDAHAKNISIHLIDSGVTEIRVIDDGVGMDPVDAKMCVLPHATSKIKSESDLFSIRTLGFRGEALPSIVAVSSFRLVTSTDGNKGYMFSLKGGVPMSEAVIAHDKGTEITVRNLFFNTPARLQNLQSQNVELSYITDLVSKVAFANPGISFTLTNNGKQIIKTNGNGELLEVIASVMGNDCAKNMFKVFDTNGTYRVSGYISNNNLTRASKNYMYIYINGRTIKSFNINNAIIKGYDTLLMTGRYPVVVLNFEADYSLVDVNVHPTKAEVRFYDEEGLLSMITEMVSNCLKKEDLTVNINLLGNEENKPQEYNKVEEEYELSFDDDEEFVNEIEEQEENDLSDSLEDEEYEYKDETDDSYEEELDDNFELEDEENINENEEDDYQYEDLDSEDDEDEEFVNDIADPSLFEYKEINSKEPEEIKVEKFTQQQFDLSDNEIIDKGTKRVEKLGMLQYIGQLFGTYILAQTEDELVVIDQHAAAERINYEKILASLQNDENIGYDLLVPFNLEFTPSEMILVNECMELINDLGIVLEEFGNNSFVVRRIPIWIFRGKEKEFVEEIITQIISGRKSTKIEFLNSLAKSLACKKSIKANEYHSQIEIEYILDDLKNTSNPFTCPHGRPIIIKFDKYEIEKWFKRIV